jgi:hypothetical protein
MLLYEHCNVKPRHLARAAKWIIPSHLPDRGLGLWSDEMPNYVDSVASSSCLY